MSDEQLGSKQDEGTIQKEEEKEIKETIQTDKPEETAKLVAHKALRKIETGIPEAMPLMMRISTHNFKEPEDIQSRLRRGKTLMLAQKGKRNRLNSGDDDEDVCDHNAAIENWKCQKCQGQLANFHLVFDNKEGKVKNFTRIVYENSFLDDFKQEFKAQTSLDKKQTVIYQCYEPDNIMELKEYMFMLMCDRIQKVNKAAAADPKMLSPFGSGTYSNLSPKLQTYLKNTKERHQKIRRQQPDCLLFDALFESGNLLQAERNANDPSTYNLFMQVDTNTRGHQQWFYFRAKGGVKGKTYTFMIMNFTKPGVSGGRGYKLGEHDIRIMARSKRKQIQLNDFEKWEDLTSKTAECSYVKTSVARRKRDVIAAGADSDQEAWIEEAFNQKPTMPGEKPTLPNLPVEEKKGNDGDKERKVRKRKVFYYYALKFKYTFEHDNDTVYFAFSKPITYTEILEDLSNKERLIMPKKDQLTANATCKKLFHKNGIEKDEKSQEYEKIIKNPFKNEIVIENSQQNIYYKRTQFCETIGGLPLYKIIIGRDLRSVKNNSIVLITSRVHSGETPGSEVFRGIYNFITSDSREAKYLRRFYTFILVPCMNPDGVVIGNYRNSCAGVDLNRQWINPEPAYHPEVCGVKNIMQEIKEEDKRQIWIFCDLHGHSKKKNSFFYGCNTAANGGFLSWTIVRLLPRIFAQKTHMFNYKDCRFRVEPYKIGTARIVAWKQFSITHSFTLENSFYGYELGENESQIFSMEEYQNVGLKFILSIYEMHHLWKQIKRELQITHGWLKPRTLNEMTGVPAAQIKAQEVAQQKEDERKKQAIQQYEDFLKKFYQTSGGYTRPKQKFKSKQVKDDRQLIENLVDKKEEEGDQQVVKKIELPQNEPIIEEAMEQEESDEDYYLKMHTGLTKIQALIRGFIARKRVKKLVEQKEKRMLNNMINNANARTVDKGIKRQRSNQLIANSSAKKLKLGRVNPPSQANLAGVRAERRTKKGYDTDSDGGAMATAKGTSGKQFGDSSEDQLLRSNTEQLPINNFSDSGLNTSGERGSGNLGSNSLFGWSKKTNLIGSTNKNPPMAWREYFQADELDRAYQIVEVEQRDETDGESDNSMGSNSNPSEDNFDEEKVYRDVYGVDNAEDHLEAKKQAEQEFIDKVAVAPNDDLLNNALKKQNNMLEALNDNSLEQELLQGPITEQKKQEKSDFDPKETLLTQRKSVNGQQNEPLKSQRGTPKGVKSQIGTQPLDNIFQASQLGQRRQLKTSQQQRVMINQSNLGPPQLGQTVSHYNLGEKLNAAKLVQQSYKIHQALGKKQNINQAIKDCFIIKRMGSKSGQQSKSTGKSRGLSRARELAAGKGGRKLVSKNPQERIDLSEQRQAYHQATLQKQAILERMQQQQLQQSQQAQGPLVSNLQISFNHAQSKQKFAPNAIQSSKMISEQQAQDLINQLNQAMKNMSQQQAIAFLKMIQEKNVYLQINQKQQQVRNSSQEPASAQPFDTNSLTDTLRHEPASASKAMYQRLRGLDGQQIEANVANSAMQVLNPRNSFSGMQDQMLSAQHARYNQNLAATAGTKAKPLFGENSSELQQIQRPGLSGRGTRPLPQVHGPGGKAPTIRKPPSASFRQHSNQLAAAWSGNDTHKNQQMSYIIQAQTNTAPQQETPKQKPSYKVNTDLQRTFYGQKHQTQISAGSNAQLHHSQVSNEGIRRMNEYENPPSGSLFMKYVKKKATQMPLNVSSGMLGDSQERLTLTQNTPQIGAGQKLGVRMPRIAGHSHVYAKGQLGER